MSAQQMEDLLTVTQYIRSIVAHDAPLTVARVAEGVSTVVYRVDAGERTYYLRILPEPGASFAPEVAVHRQLRAAGLHVPEVVYFEHHNGLFQRSLMLTKAIAGRAIGYTQPPAAVRQIAIEAGRELAKLNQVAVAGYGWVRRDAADPRLRAEHPTLARWLTEEFEAPIRALRRCRDLSARDASRLLELLSLASQQLEHEQAVLAHGDFDVTHIFYHEGVYSGIIDFGEIRGAHQLYDLGHFAVENSDLLPHLLAGYTAVTPLDHEAQRHIYLTGLLIAARRIGRRILQERDPHPPDNAFIQRTLADFTERCIKS
jgi:aminoglycoside phosphotransferase (APT) family kinase protein